MLQQKKVENSKRKKSERAGELEQLWATPMKLRKLDDNRASTGSENRPAKLTRLSKDLASQSFSTLFAALLAASRLQVTLQEAGPEVCGILPAFRSGKSKDLQLVHTDV